MSSLRLSHPYRGSCPADGSRPVLRHVGLFFLDPNLYTVARTTRCRGDHVYATSCASLENLTASVWAQSRLRPGPLSPASGCGLSAGAGRCGDSSHLWVHVGLFGMPLRCAGSDPNGRPGCFLLVFDCLQLFDAGEVCHADDFKSKLPGSPEAYEGYFPW